MNTPHTPAPWVRMGQGTLTHPVTRAPVTLERIETPLGMIEVLDLTNEPEGNLTLMIASPDMLEALKWIERMANQSKRWAIRNIAREAIAKATQP